MATRRGTDAEQAAAVPADRLSCDVCGPGCGPSPRPDVGVEQVTLFPSDITLEHTERARPALR